MKVTLLHALAVVLTVLLFVVRHRGALLAVYSSKRRCARQQSSQHDADKPAARSDSQEPVAVSEVHMCKPKYKRDPVIEVDSKEIGSQPRL